MRCVCAPFSAGMGKTKYLSAFEQGMVVGARHTGLSVSRTATLLGFSRSIVPVCITGCWWHLNWERLMVMAGAE
jgi:hypothetical protein